MGKEEGRKVEMTNEEERWEEKQDEGIEIEEPEKNE